MFGVTAAKAPVACLVDGAKSVNELSDAVVFLWAATKRCSSTTGNPRSPQCPMDIASAAQNVAIPHSRLWLWRPVQSSTAFAMTSTILATFCAAEAMSIGHCGDLGLPVVLLQRFVAAQRNTTASDNSFTDLAPSTKHATGALAAVTPNIPARRNIVRIIAIVSMTLNGTRDSNRRIASSPS